MTKADFDKTYWIWYWGIGDNVMGIQFISVYEDLIKFTETHQKENNQEGYWSTHDKVGKQDSQMKIINLNK